MRKFIFLLICFFWGVSFSWAITIDCPEVVSPGEEFKIYITDNNYNGIKAKYDFASDFVYQGISLSNNFKSYYDGVNGFSVGTATNDGELGLDVRVKVGNEVIVNNEYNLGFVDIEASDSGYRSVKIEDVFCKVRVLSDINTLSSLSVDGVSLSPKFSANVLSYRGTTKNDRVTIKASASDSGAKVEGDIGEKKLKIGVNTFVIKVTSAKGNVKEYKIYITRENKSNDITLRSLKLSSGELDFKSDVFFYSVNVGNEVEKIEVEAVASSDKAKVDIQKPDILVIGENEINIVVTAEDGSVATYVVVVNRKEKLSSDATIKSLIVKNYELDFKSDIYEYDLEIDEEDSLDIEVILADDKAKYNINGNSNLKNGSVIEIKVTAEDGSIKIYKINIIKKLVERNSGSIGDYLGLIPIIGFILLIVAILIVKLIKKKYVKFDK